MDDPLTVNKGQGFLLKPITAIRPKNTVIRPKNTWNIKTHFLITGSQVYHSKENVCQGYISSV